MELSIANQSVIQETLTAQAVGEGAEHCKLFMSPALVQSPHSLNVATRHLTMTIAMIFMDIMTMLEPAVFKVRMTLLRTPFDASMYNCLLLGGCYVYNSTINLLQPVQGDKYRRCTEGRRPEAHVNNKATYTEVCNLLVPWQQEMQLSQELQDCTCISQATCIKLLEITRATCKKLLERT